KTLTPGTNSLQKILNRLRGTFDFPDKPLGGRNPWLKVPTDRELSNVEISQLKTVSGAEAFKLYDTYGFPLDLTELKARELGLSVDVASFEKLMEQQRSRSRGAQKKETIEVTSVQPLWGPTKFVGYDHLIAEGGHFVVE